MQGHCPYDCNEYYEYGDCYDYYEYNDYNYNAITMMTTIST